MNIARRILAVDNLRWQSELMAWGNSMFGAFSTRFNDDDQTFIIRTRDVNRMDAGDLANLFKIVRKYNLIFSIVVNKKQQLSIIFAINGSDPDRGSSIDVSRL